MFAVIAEHGYDGLVRATFMARLILLLVGLFRAENQISYVPEPLAHGFTIGIGVIIAISNIKDFLGLLIANPPADFIEKISALWAAQDSFSLPDFGVALMTLALTVVVDLPVTIGTGIAFSLALRLRRRNIPPEVWDVPER